MEVFLRLENLIWIEHFYRCGLQIAYFEKQVRFLNEVLDRITDTIDSHNFWIIGLNSTAYLDCWRGE